MAKFFDQLSDALVEFIDAQKVFFVATAPQHGRVNLSPKGVDSFRVLSPRQVAYVDLTGSGNETAAHLLENGRLTFMFCSFDRTPLILRLYCRGRAVHPGDPEWAALAAQLPAIPGTRQFILGEIESGQTSCGFGLPLYEYQGERETLVAFAEKKGEDGLRAYRSEHNLRSIDGLPTGLTGSEDDLGNA